MLYKLPGIAVNDCHCSMFSVHAIIWHVSSDLLAIYLYESGT